MVNDGPLRDPNGSPENRTFMDELLRGMVPLEISRTRKNPQAPMNIALSDKRTETFTPPPYIAFSHGTTLGGSVGSAGAGASGASGASSFFNPSNLPPVPTLDESLPTTVVQVKTTDGKKLKLKVNTSISVAQFAALVAASNPGSATPFALSAGFPPKDLVDREATVEAAGLKGAAVIQK